MSRTTIHLPDALQTELKILAHEQRCSFKDLVNDVIRKGLTVMKGKKIRASLQWHTASAKPSPAFDPSDRETYLDLLDRSTK
ncbi:MAG: hypothetical protein HYV02_07495 [Deltaproteobacteria bacterium]|nr:hypothetical protein [Deltaproteobacteria bacterium]